MGDFSFGFWDFDDLYHATTGSDQADDLKGKSLFNNINGMGGNDTVMGGGLLDVLKGGDGIDTVSYANACSGVTVDLSKTGLQFTGGGGIDILSGFERIVGSKYNDKLTGDAGDNWLDGGLGKDTLIGGKGNDAYFVDNAGDKVVEYANEGTDLVFSTIDYTLGANVERLQLSGTAIRGTGNELDNIIRGNDMNNVLTGGGGHDSLYGGAGADTFVFNAIDEATSDKVHDFESGVDKIAVSGAVFGIAKGALPADYFVFSDTLAVAKDGTDPIATSTEHGQFVLDRYHNLYWDADGAGAGTAVLIAGFGTAHPVLGDLLVI